ncbi:MULTISPECIES: GPR1/FUN34/YaaH family transporter [unclassified Streptomyces]|uniref:GPR1/FUN34/YaaH family transporter n=1 Tax=unclassified Streptomyces TaxID=2593676 RepID=UPI00224D6B45|nr:MULTISPECIES: GPR1/FUN34/YaaH family transporter [unclassified Streptomyces]MCX4990738.1 GPR1/FUN34/YaaH family transporter [Streptomyces sp. NBC_00568]MCX5004031.1 GPR1/FUN34/YaaH family transporter [Streptomyces sp. NBC_00638]
MDNDVSAGSTTTIVGRLALGVTLLAFGLGYTDLIDGVTAADAVSLAHYVGGVALFVAGLLAFRDRDPATGTAFTGLGALWFTWAVSAGGQVSDNAAGLFLLLFALVVLSLTLAGGDVLGRGTYGLFFVSLLLLAIGRFADNSELAKAGGWFAVAAGAVAWYAATAALAHWPTALPRRAAGRGVTATG